MFRSANLAGAFLAAAGDWLPWLTTPATPLDVRTAFTRTLAVEDSDSHCANVAAGLGGSLLAGRESDSQMIGERGRDLLVGDVVSAVLETKVARLEVEWC